LNSGCIQESSADSRPHANPTGIREAMTNPNDWNRVIIDEFHSNAGQLGGAFPGRPMLLLPTIGAQSGQRRTNFAMYLQHGAQLGVLVSNGGAATSPA
jgi:hypothetical protein